LIAHGELRQPPARVPMMAAAGATHGRCGAAATLLAERHWVVMPQLHCHAMDLGARDASDSATAAPGVCGSGLGVGAQVGE
jgi:hypothetical protein